MTADVALRGWLRLTLIPGVGGESRRQLLKAFGLPDAIFSAGASALRAAVGATLAERLLAHDSFAETLSAAGLTIVSGLALGIDAAAHRGALAGRGSTVAIIGTGADRIYPAGNEALARAIAERGVVLSEFPLGTPAIAANFPRRNRIIAGISRGCLVVEAAERSGSLITARLAAEGGREVFAIPGSIHSPLSKGCHKLIKQGAKLVDRAEDILEELRWESVVAAAPATEQPPADPEAAALLAAMGYDPCTVDGLADRTRLTAEQLLAMLLPLELDGHVTQLPGGRYQRIPQRAA